MPLRLVISRSHRCTRSPRTSLKPRAASGELPSRLLNKLNRLAHERPIALALPDTSTAAGVSQAQQTVLEAVGAGELLPSEGTTLAGILESRRKALELLELERRISELEYRADGFKLRAPRRGA